MSTGKHLGEEIYFNGGLDTDSDDKLIQQGDYIDALNITKFYDGDGGVVVNSKGNEKITNSFLPSGTNKCIGWCADDENNAIIIFNYNSNNNHGIYRYLKDSDTFEKIVHEESVLSFSSDTVNLQAHVVGDLLYWNEGKDIGGSYINVPRKLNLVKAYNFTNQASGSVSVSSSVDAADIYDDIDADTLSAIKKPAISNIYANLLTDGSFSYNFLNATYYQFSLELVFDDNEKSVLSNRTNFVFTEVGGTENYIAIRFGYDYVGSTVSKINVYYRDSIASDFILGGTIDVYSPSNVYDNQNDTLITSALVDGTFYNYRFYGKSGGAFYSGDSGKLFDSLPINANSQIYSENRMFYGGAKLSYNKSDVDVDYEIYDGDNGTLTGVSIQAFDGEVYNSSTSAGLKITGLDDAIFNELDIDYNKDVGMAFNADVTIATINDPKNEVFVLGGTTFLSTYSQSDVRDQILNDWTFGFADSGSGGTAYAEWEFTGSDYILVVATPTLDTASGASISQKDYAVVRNDDTYMLPGSYYQFCIYLFDDYFRTTGAIYNEDSKIFIPAATSMDNTQYTWGIEWTVNERLPGWVRYVSFGYSRCLDFSAVWQIVSPTYSSGDRSFLIPEGYVYQDGDVIRIFGDDTVYDIESGDDTKIYMPFGFSYTSGEIEILRPNQVPNDSVFYELSVLYNYDQSGYVRGNLGQDNGYFVGGDFNMYDAGSGYEGLSHLDSNDTLFYTFRRIIPELDDYGDIEYQSVYFSQKYFDNTKINGLNSFDFDNRNDLSDVNGDIIDIKRVGEVLYVVQRREITSFYLGKTILKQSSTGEVIADTSQVLGGKRESAFEYGSVFGTSQMDNVLFGYDIYKGVFWRNGYNGVNVISGKDVTGNYKMDTYFKVKSRALLDSGIENVTVLIGIDKPNETVYVTFIDTNTSSNNETISFHIPTNRWISKYSFVPEDYAWLDDKIYSFDSGEIYEHYSDSVNRCNFYGTDYDSYIQFVSHAAANQVKVFNTLWVHSDKEWIADPIEADANSNYPNGMYTKILSSEWVKEEGIYRAAIARNMKTRSSSATNYDRINGEEMRAKVIRVKITNNDTTKTELFKAEINSELSR